MNNTVLAALKSRGVILPLFMTWDDAEVSISLMSSTEHDFAISITVENGDLLLTVNRREERDANKPVVKLVLMPDAVGFFQASGPPEFQYQSSADMEQMTTKIVEIVQASQSTLPTVAEILEAILSDERFTKYKGNEEIEAQLRQQAELMLGIVMGVVKDDAVNNGGWSNNNDSETKQDE